MRLHTPKRLLLGELVLFEQLWVSLDVKAADTLSAKHKPLQVIDLQGFFAFRFDRLGLCAAFGGAPSLTFRLAFRDGITSAAAVISLSSR